MLTTSLAADVRVMSFNIRYGKARDGENHWDKRRDFVAETIKAFDPDLLGTQETLEFQKDFLAGKLPAYEAIGVGRDDGGDEGEMTAVFFKRDRFELLDQGHFWLSETPEVPGSISWDSSLTRMASWVRLRDRKSQAERPILFVNTHFDHVGAEARKQSAKLIRQMATSLGQGCDVVITGDFNAGVGSDPYQALFGAAPEASEAGQATSRTFTDTYKFANQSHSAGEQAGEATFSGFQADVTKGSRIDWIAVSGNWKILSATIDRTSRQGRSPSDHYPVTATLRQMPKPPSSLRVVSYNIKRGFGNDNRTDLARTARTLEALNPDIVGLQEVDENAERSGRVDQAAFLGEQLNMQHAFGPFMDFQGGRYGLAILSKYPISGVNVVELPTGNEPRVALAIDISLPSGNIVTVVNIHLDWVSDDGFRYAQATALKSFLDSLENPYLLLGDFNDLPNSRTVKLLGENMIEAEKPSEQPMTFSATKAVKEIDYIFGAPISAWQFNATRVIEEPLTSDHLPVFTEAWLWNE